ncbi:YcgL domain-containing protein [Shewanella sp. YIC-542]|uniref:YcgL domain-containing protein n=1 Tax=Shewanella mytili TaxID=3377111 RepID=UPI00398E563A
MICAVYKSRRKADTYLFIKQKNNFDVVPEPLLKVFGQPELVMLLPLEKRQHLGMADINKVKAELEKNGYYLQLPPPQVNLLKEFLAEQGVSPTE